MLFRVLDSSFWIVGSLNHGVNWELQSETLRLSVCIVMVPQWYVSQVYSHYLHSHYYGRVWSAYTWRNEDGYGMRCGLNAFEFVFIFEQGSSLSRGSLDRSRARQANRDTR